MHNEWRNGIEDLESGEFWEAHESWEAVWHALPESAARETTQALIQFAAACYKVRQADEGRSREEMQRGMRGLIERARGHLESAGALGSPHPSWEPARLEEALDQLDDVLEEWQSGAAQSSVANDVQGAADDLAAHLRDPPGPVESRET